jgi:hypothetical protein
VCVRGTASAALSLPVATPQSPSAPAHADEMARHRAALPRPWSESDGAVAWREAPNARELVLTFPTQVEVAFYPHTDTQLALAGQAAIPAGAGTALRLTLRQDNPPERVRGVIGVVQGADTRYYEVDVPWP